MIILRPTPCLYYSQRGAYSTPSMINGIPCSHSQRTRNGLGEDRQRFGVLELRSVLTRAEIGDSD